jgi:hypothetical protein
MKTLGFEHIYGDTTLNKLAVYGWFFVRICQGSTIALNMSKKPRLPLSHVEQLLHTTHLHPQNQADDGA